MLNRRRKKANLHVFCTKGHCAIWFLIGVIFRLAAAYKVKAKKAGSRFRQEGVGGTGFGSARVGEVLPR